MMWCDMQYTRFQPIQEMFRSRQLCTDIQQSPMTDYIDKCIARIKKVSTGLNKDYSPNKYLAAMNEDDFLSNWCRNMAEMNDSSSDSGSSPTDSIPIPSRRPTQCKRRRTRRQLMLDTTSPTRPSLKRSRSPDQSPVTPRPKFSKRLPFSPSSSVENSPQSLGNTPNQSPTTLSQRPTFDADSSPDLLPTIAGKVGDVKSVSAETMADVLTGRLVVDADVTIVDCRYPYEYDGGHIKGAINLFTKEEVTHRYFTSTNETSERPQVIIFHCEFSSERGPKMYRHIRAHDRHVNADNYPRLCYPNIYLLDSGYSQFYAKHKDLCTPEGYTSMFDRDHKMALRKFRIKSKSWPVSSLRNRTNNDLRMTLDFE